MCVCVKQTGVTYLLAYKRHDSNASQHMLSRQSFAWNAVSKGLGVVSARFTEMSHEQRDVRLEFTLRLPTQVSHQPVYVPTVHTHRHIPTQESRDVVSETAFLVSRCSRPEFCGLRLGLEGLVVAVFKTDQ